MIRILERLFGNAHGGDLVALWHRVVELAREEHWYATRGVADTVEGRFDMVTAVTALVIIRLEREGLVEHAARLTELFIDDMDGQLREAGVGDLVVGKSMGKLVSALGGRIGAYRDGLAAEGDASLAEAAARNTTMLDGADPEPLAQALRALAADIDRPSREDLLKGNIAR
ncbi:ubiquinol-cytochrome C chaperone family protein [Croceicoccus sp. BE223]|uniref:ubiquinol-cytochrome C chaperone family protein n=1 Tax=Croceicoccus sp. BE223 TaxID=2817716 RepID=UPI00285D0236|nr:ubiquinol-cytochrome C chaperone family protein [Croceicoccus sp. BE223]MDR7103820.1 cytochrome b pre-mRNA-processing protein 3 [Croceicoccus sp. BE223]